MKQPHCTYCDKDGHYQSFCSSKPRKPIQTKAIPFKPPKPCKLCGKTGHRRYQCLLNTNKPKRNLQSGKAAERWTKTRHQWFEDNMAPAFICHYCHVGLMPFETTLDHRIPRSRAPELRYVLSNLVPSCFPCNSLKGSIDHDHYPHTCPDIHEAQAA